MLKKFLNLITSPTLMAIFTIAGFAFGIYGTVFYERRPDATISIESDSPVFDVHTDVSELSIAYAGNDLRKSNQTLRLIKIRFANTGRTDIAKRDYDENDPVGFEIQNGKVVEVPATLASNDYLRRNLRLSRQPSRITVSPVILEAGEFIELQLLVLTTPTSQISVVPLGKLAGIKDIKVVRPDDSEGLGSVWHRAVAADDWKVQFLRGPVYSLLSLGSLALLAIFTAIVVAPITSFRDFMAKKQRQAQLSGYMSGRALSECEKLVIESYRVSGKRGLARLLSFCDQVPKRNELIGKLEPVLDEAIIQDTVRRNYPVLSSVFDRLNKSGVVTQDGLKIFVAPALLEALAEVSRVIGFSLESLRETQSYIRSPHDDYPLFDALVKPDP